MFLLLTILACGPKPPPPAPAPVEVRLNGLAAMEQRQPELFYDCAPKSSILHPEKVVEVEVTGESDLTSGLVERITATSTDEDAAKCVESVLLRRMVRPAGEWTHTFRLDTRAWPLEVVMDRSGARRVGNLDPGLARDVLISRGHPGVINEVAQHEVLQGTLHTAAPALNACSEGLHDYQPRPMALLELEVGRKGEVSQVLVRQSDLKEPQRYACLQRAVLALSFPESVTPGTYTWLHVW